MKKMKFTFQLSRVGQCGLRVLFFVALGHMCLGVATAQYTFDFSINPNGSLAPALTNPQDYFSGGTPSIDNNETQNMLCNVPGFANWRCNGNADTTPFMSELIVIDNVEYVHQVIGDPNDGFAQEYYIPRDQLVRVCPSAAMTNVCSLADWNGDMGPLTNVNNGNMDPTNIVIKQVLSSSDGSFSSVFLKDQLNNKPLIQQTLTLDIMTATFETDMRAISYDDANTAAPVDISQQFTDAWLDNFASWDSTDTLNNPWDTGTGRNTNATAAKYTYDANTSLFTYVQGETGFDPSVLDDPEKYSRYFDPAQNTGCDPAQRDDIVCTQ